MKAKETLRRDIEVKNALSRPSGHSPLPAVVAEFLGDAGLPVSAAAFVDLSDLNILAERFRKADQADLALQLWRGANLAALKREHPGEYLQFLAQIGMPRSTAHTLTSVFEKCCALRNADTLRAIAPLDASKRVELARWTPEEIDAFGAGREVRGVTLESASELNFKAFREAIASGDAKISKLEKRLEDGQKVIEGLEQQLAKMRRQHGQPDPSMPPQLAALRDEATFLTEKMSESLARVAGECRRLLLDPSWRDKPDADARMAVASFAFHSLQGVIVVGAELLAEFEKIFSRAVTGTLAPGAQYSPDEIEHAKALRAAAQEVAQAEQRHARIKAMNDNGVKGVRPKAGK